MILAFTGVLSIEQFRCKDLQMSGKSWICCILHVLSNVVKILYRFAIVFFSLLFHMRQARPFFCGIHNSAGIFDILLFMLHCSCDDFSIRSNTKLLILQLFSAFYSYCIPEELNSLINLAAVRPRYKINGGGNYHIFGQHGTWCTSLISLDKINWLFFVSRLVNNVLWARNYLGITD